MERTDTNKAKADTKRLYFKYLTAGVGFWRLKCAALNVSYQFYSR